MPSDRSVLEGQIERVELRPFTLDRFHRRRQRKELNRRIGSAVVALVVAGVAIGGLLRAFSSGKVPAGESFARANGEVLRFTTPVRSTRSFGDLVAVNPETGEERVLVENLSNVISAEWSADGRWVAYERYPLDSAGGEIELWVVSASQAPRLVATGGAPDLFATLGLAGVVWSPTGAELAAIDSATLITIDPVTGETSDLGSIDGAWGRNTLFSPDPAWSPNGTHIAIGARGGALYSVDVRSGERSLLARLPGADFGEGGESLWSPDGAHIAVVNHLEHGGWRLSMMNTDGSSVRLLVEDVHDMGPAGVAWSPDGTRLAYADYQESDGSVRIWVVPMDGSAPAEIGSLGASCHFAYKCDLTWSPDGSRIAFTDETAVGVPEAGQGNDLYYAIDADGSGEAEPIAELTYRSWDGGSYSCGC